VKYAWITKNKERFAIIEMCRVFSVSISGYYDHRDRETSPRAKRKKETEQIVQQLFHENYGIYGSYKIADIMKERDDLKSACRNTIATAMRELGLKSKVCKQFKPTTTTADPSKKPAKNILDRNFHTDKPNQKWVTDITYIHTASGWVYLAAVLDLFSRKIVGWSMSESLSTRLVSDALRIAIEARRPSPGLLHHSDRGCQYTSDAYQKTLATMGIVCSMSRTGNCYDNAVMERFFWSLKQEWTNHEVFEDLPAARISVFKYIETFYNSRRIHQTLGYQTPDAFEAAFEQASTNNINQSNADHAPACSTQQVA
jgi:putative transposase